MRVKVKGNAYMKIHQRNVYDKQVYYRLIALWVICESFAGGIMHGIKLPFTGLIVSSLAITCIILIAFHYPSRTSVIKATLLVAVFKLMLSPHSPPTAYIAVFFQGITGQLLLRSPRFFKTGAIILSVLALVESAIQRLLVLLVVYGNNLWDAVNLFIQKITNESTQTNYSLFITVSYVVFHGIAGIFIGVYAVRLAIFSKSEDETISRYLFRHAEDKPDNSEILKKRGNKKWIFSLILFLLAFLYLQGMLQPSKPIVPKGVIVHMMLRAGLILLTWYLVAGPLIVYFLKKLLRGQQQKYSHEVDEIMALLPKTRNIFTTSIRVSKKEKGFSRLKLFLKLMLVNVLKN